MMTTLIDEHALSRLLNETEVVLIDCRFDLADTTAGEAAYERGHIPGAVYAHLDRDLSGPPATDSGRHPLPTPAAMTNLFNQLGIASGSQVVVYDDARGVYASRLWWMLRYMGHEAVALLDGGWQVWEAAGYPVESGRRQNTPALFMGEPQSERLVVLEQVPGLGLLIDSREESRYRGEVEPLDPRAGHIPGAINSFYDGNYGGDGRFLPRVALRERFNALVGKRAPSEVTFYCGSGVSACVNILAMTHAGLGDARLYVGSWSEWSQDPSRPAATGPEAD